MEFCHVKVYRIHLHVILSTKGLVVKWKVKTMKEMKLTFYNFLNHINIFIIYRRNRFFHSLKIRYLKIFHLFHYSPFKKRQYFPVMKDISPSLIVQCGRTGHPGRYFKITNLIISHWSHCLMFFTNLQVFPGLPLQQVHYRYPQLLCCYRHVYYHRSLSGLTYLFLCGCEINIIQW